MHSSFIGTEDRVARVCVVFWLTFCRRYVGEQEMLMNSGNKKTTLRVKRVWMSERLANWLVSSVGWLAVHFHPIDSSLATDNCGYKCGLLISFHCAQEQQEFNLLFKTASLPLINDQTLFNTRLILVKMQLNCVWLCVRGWLIAVVLIAKNFLCVTFFLHFLHEFDLLSDFCFICALFCLNVFPNEITNYFLL